MGGPRNAEDGVRQDQCGDAALRVCVIDEDIDQIVIGALRSKDGQALWRLPREKLRGGTSEILNWVALAGVVEPMELKYLEYVTTYRSPAATGCGMGFAYWL